LRKAVADLADACGTAMPSDGMRATDGVRLDLYQAKGFDRGRPAWIEAIWLLLQPVLVTSPLSCSLVRRLALRLMGAHIGRGVTIKGGVRVKFPWRLRVGDHCWIGQDAWLDNLAEIIIGNHCCLSQGVYLCTGSHDWASTSFDLMVKPIVLEDQVWLAAHSVVGPGVVARRGAVLALGSVATAELSPWHIHRGNPAFPIRPRAIRNSKGKAAQPET
jgi:putative colanic acid biosynthesis acetyltransferase WcaF